MLNSHQNFLLSDLKVLYIQCQFVKAFLFLKYKGFLFKCDSKEWKITLKSVAFIIAASKLLEVDLDFLFISIIESSSNKTNS